MDFDKFAESILLKISTMQIPLVYIIEFILPQCINFETEHKVIGFVIFMILIMLSLRFF